MSDNMQEDRVSEQKVDLYNDLGKMIISEL